MTTGIGILNEGPLHQALKALYRTPDSVEEVSVDGYVADLRAGDNVIYEIQTGHFAPLKRKLAALLAADHRIVVVHPVTRIRTIVKLPDDPDGTATRRRSPKRGGVADVVGALVSIPRLLDHPNFELEVVLIDEDEYRVHDPDRVRGRGGWRVVRRDLKAVVERRRFRTSADLFSLVHGPLPEAFTTAMLAEAMPAPRWLAQKLAYCLREAGAITISGKAGNALVYRKSSPP